MREGERNKRDSMRRTGGCCCLDGSGLATKRRFEGLRSDGGAAFTGRRFTLFRGCQHENRTRVNPEYRVEIIVIIGVILVNLLALF